MIVKYYNIDGDGSGAGGGTGGEGGDGAGAQKPVIPQNDEGGDGGSDGEEMQFFDNEDQGGSSKPVNKKDAADTGQQSAKADYSRFKEVFDDEEELDDEKVFTRTKGLKSENENLRLLAQGRDAIDQDKAILAYRNLLQENNETLAFLTMVNDYIDADIPKAQAESKARADIAEIKAKEKGVGEKELEKIALQTRKFLKGNIKERENEIIEKVKTAQKSVDLRPKDSDTIEKSKSEVAKLDSFIGFKLPAAHKDKIVKAAQDYIGSEQEKKDLSDPLYRAKFAMFRAHEGQWEKNVQSRKSGKFQAVQKALEKPKMVQGRIPTKVLGSKNTGQGTGRIMKNPGAFLGGVK